MTVNIHGKEYKTVAERVNEFRKTHPTDAIVTEIISNDNEYVVMKASISIDTIVATGHAQEKYGSTNINKTSALENCETSAIGRALASFGLGGTEFASADEVATAIQQQVSGEEYHPNGDSQRPTASPNKPASPKQKKFLNELYLNAGGEDGMQKEFIVGEGFDPEDLSSADASVLIEKLQKGQ